MYYSISERNNLTKRNLNFRYILHVINLGDERSTHILLRTGVVLQILELVLVPASVGDFVEGCSVVGFVGEHFGEHLQEVLRGLNFVFVSF